MTRYARKKDGNQAAIVAALRKIPGLRVIDTHAFPGFVDIVIGYKGRNWLIELKDPKQYYQRTRKTEVKQAAFRAEWPGQCAECKTLDDVLDVIGLGKGWEG